MAKRRLINDSVLCSVPPGLRGHAVHWRQTRCICVLLGSASQTEKAPAAHPGGRVQSRGEGVTLQSQMERSGLDIFGAFQ